MTKAFLLSEETKAILDAMIEERVKRLLNTAGRRWIEPDDNIQAPEVYLARIPGAGIAALTLGGDAGTGTGTAAADDVVGSAECEIYRLLSVSGVPTFTSCGFVRKVYNTSTSAVPGGTWAPVARDKFGTWYVTGFVPESGGSITVAGRDFSGTPISQSGITTLSIRTDDSDVYDVAYLGYSGLDTAVFLINSASTSSGGLISDTTQHIPGFKNFDQPVNFKGGIYDGAGTSPSYLQINRTSIEQGKSSLDGSAIEIENYLDTIYSAFRFPSVHGVDVHPLHIYYDGAYLIFLPDSSLVLGDSVSTNLGDVGATPDLETSPTSSVFAGKFYAITKIVSPEYWASASIQGLTGTIGLGATATAGLVTALGTTSGSNGQIYIGTGSGFTLATLTAGNGITITNGSGTITIAAATQMSLTADGSGLKLSGDSGSPGNNYFYGTDGSGTKGWYSTSGFSTTQEQVEDWVANLVTASTSVNKSYDDGAGTLSLAVIAESSVEVGGGGVRLVGDTASPGNSKLYGTNGSGTRGWYDQPTGSYTNEEAQDAVGGILVDTDTINFTYDDGVPQIIADVRTQMSVTSDATGVKLVSDASTPGNSKYYGTDSGGTKGYHSLPTDFLNYVTAPAYSDSSGTVNDYSYDGTYVYLCVATDTWKRWAYDAGFLPEPP